MAATLGPWTTRTVNADGTPDISFDDLIPARGAQPAAGPQQVTWWEGAPPASLAQSGGASAPQSPASPLLAPSDEEMKGLYLKQVRQKAATSGLQSLTDGELKTLHNAISFDDLIPGKQLGANLPAGFTLDTEPREYGAELPAGFVLDKPQGGGSQLPAGYTLDAAPQGSALRSISDDDLRGLYLKQVRQKAAASGLKSLSDNELRALHNSITFDDLIPKPNSETYGDPTPWGGLEDRTPEAESLKAAAQYKGPSHAATHGTDYSFDSATRSLPVVGPALQSNSPELQAWEQAHPGETKALRVGANLVALAPAIGAAPEAFGAGAGQGLLARMLMGGASNAGITAADTAARGGSKEDIQRNALASALIGGGMPGVSSAATAASPYAKMFLNNLGHSGFVPARYGGDALEGLAAYFTHGTSEIPLGLYRLANGTAKTVKQLQADGLPITAAPGAERRMSGAMLNEALARALTKREPQQ